MFASFTFVGAFSKKLLHSAQRKMRISVLQCAEVKCEVFRALRFLTDINSLARYLFLKNYLLRLYFNIKSVLLTKVIY